MTPQPQVCTNRCYRHKGSSLSLDYFHKGCSPPDCYLYHSRCSDCRKSPQIPLPPHLLPPSPANASRKSCQRCHRDWSLPRFPNCRDEYCEFCQSSSQTSSQTSSQSSPASWDPPTSRPQTPTLPPSSDPPTSRPQTPPTRHRSPPPRTPDSTGLTPSTRRSRARQRLNSPPTSPSPNPDTNLERPRRTIRPRHFYGDTPTPPPELRQCSRNNHLKPLADYIDRVTGEEYNVYEACRAEIERRR